VTVLDFGNEILKLRIDINKAKEELLFDWIIILFRILKIFLYICFGLGRIFI